MDHTIRLLTPIVRRLGVQASDAMYHCGQNECSYGFVFWEFITSVMFFFHKYLVH